METLVPLKIPRCRFSFPHTTHCNLLLLGMLSTKCLAVRRGGSGADDGRPARRLCCLYLPINPRQTCSVNASRVSLRAGWLALKMMHALTAGTKEIHMLVHYHASRDRTNKTGTLSSKYLPVAVTRKLNSIFFHIFTDLRLGWYSCRS